MLEFSYVLVNGFHKICILKSVFDVTLS